MKRAWIVLGAVALSALVAPANAAEGERNLTVAKMVATNCSTDGGPVACSLGVKFIGVAFASKWNEKVESAPLACGAGKPATVTLTVVYEYNDGTWDYIDDDAKKAKWPACVRDSFTAKADPLLKEIWTKVHDLDGSVDVRAAYKLTLSLK